MIDYNLINESIIHYEKHGFTRIEAPWTVSEYIDKITKPESQISFQLKHNNKCLVASGEQSFLYLYLKDFLPKGQFQTVTPCFRYEDFDYTHSKYFIKNELIKTDVVNESELEKIIDKCVYFFKDHLDDIKVVETESGYDIESNGHELGSYGIRENEYLKWIYATGCAEPRLSKVIKITKNGISRS